MKDFAYFFMKKLDAMFFVNENLPQTELMAFCDPYLSKSTISTWYFNFTSSSAKFLIYTDSEFPNRTIVSMHGLLSLSM